MDAQQPRPDTIFCKTVFNNQRIQRADQQREGHFAAFPFIGCYWDVHGTE